MIFLCWNLTRLPICKTVALIYENEDMAVCSFFVHKLSESSKLKCWMDRIHIQAIIVLKTSKDSTPKGKGIQRKTNTPPTIVYELCFPYCINVGHWLEGLGFIFELLSALHNYQCPEEKCYFAFRIINITVSK